MSHGRRNGCKSSEFDHGHSNKGLMYYKFMYCSWELIQMWPVPRNVTTQDISSNSQKKKILFNFVFLGYMYLKVQVHVFILNVKIHICGMEVVVMMREYIHVSNWLFSRNGNSEPTYLKMVITRPVVTVFSWVLYDCILHRKGYLAILKTQYPQWSLFSEQVENVNGRRAHKMHTQIYTLNLNSQTKYTRLHILCLCVSNINVTPICIWPFVHVFSIYSSRFEFFRARLLHALFPVYEPLM